MIRFCINTICQFLFNWPRFVKLLQDMSLSNGEPLSIAAKITSRPTDHVTALTEDILELKHFLVVHVSASVACDYC